MVGYENLVEILEKGAQKKKGITFIAKGEERYISYSELYKNSLKALNYFQEIGIKPGEEIVFQVIKDEDFLYSFWASVLGGFIPVPMPVAANDEQRAKLFRVWKVLDNPWLVTTKQIKGALESVEDEKTKLAIEHINTRIIITEKVMDEIQNGNKSGIVHNSKKGDTALIQFSSGSTGEPKGVILSHENLISNILGTVKCCNCSSEDSSLSWMPLTHDMGLIGFHLNPLVAEINQYVMCTMDFLQNPILWVDALNKYKITLTACPNFGYNHFLKFYNDREKFSWDLSHLRLILNGAEPINVDICNRFLDVMERHGLKRTAMYPVYGMAEAALGVSFPPATEELVKIRVNRKKLSVGDKIEIIKEAHNDGVVFVDLGYGVGDCEFRICDDENRSLEDSTVGNIQIKGNNVTKGYYNNNEATEKLFTPDGWLRTGDLGFLRGGRLTVTGRAKDIIFINGQNYYPVDIERIIEKVQGVKFGTVAACGVFNKDIQKEEILIFISTDEELKDFYAISENIKRIINRETNLEVDKVIPVKALPKTSSGKVQRYRLGAMYSNGEFNELIEQLRILKEEADKSRIIEAANNDTEKKLVDIWCKVLKQKTIGINESFFELGGDSLKATYILHEINKEFKTNVTIRDIFDKTTIAALGEYIERLDNSELERINKVDDRRYYPLSSAQKRIFTLCNMEKLSTAYNMPQAISMEGKLDIERIEEAFNALIDRHEGLRTSFHTVKGELVQQIHPKVNLKIEIVKDDINEENLDTLLKKHIYPFDLRKAPLMKVVLFSEDDEKHIMLLDIHHIISDGTSMGVLIKDFMTIYKGIELEPLKIQYKDYAVWHNEKLISERMKIQRQYWLHKFKEEAPVINLPADYSRPAMQSFQGNTINFRVDEILTGNLKKLAKNTNSSLFMILLSAYNILLSKYSGEEDIVVGTSAAGRTHIDIKDIIGMFVNTVVMRAYPKGSKTFNELLTEVKEKCLRSFEYQDYQFEQLVRELGVRRDLSRNPLFDTMFVMENMELPEINIDGTKFKTLSFANDISKFDLTLFAMEKGKELHFSYEFSVRLFKEETILRAVQHYINILKAIVETQEIEICNIKVLEEAEEEKILFKFNDTFAEYQKDKTIQELFEMQVEKTPSKLAVIYGEEQLTYRELNEKANRLAYTLREKGIGRDDKVAILAERSCNTVAAIYAVLKAGGAYIPIDSSYPEDRIEYILQDSNAKVLLTENKFIHKVKADIETLCIEENKIYSNCKDNLPIINTPKDLTYIIYTSGSTGKPKGVMVEQRGLVNYICWAVKSYVKNEEAIFPLFTTISFDLTVTTIFTPLVSGGTIVVYNDDEKYMSIEKVIKENRCTVVKLTPAHLKLIKGLDNSKSHIRRFIVGGEELETELAKEVHESFNGKIEICNEYGPTETVVGCMIHVYDVEKDRKKGVPIGVPSDNVKIYVLDKYLKPMPLNCPGEMYIAGDGVARGYINRDELTKERFINNFFLQGERMYKTGDLARWLSDGTIEYLGRIDDQVKIRGFRIEIGEIQNQLLKHKDISDAVVLVKERENGEKYLCAYFVSEEEPTVSQIRLYLSMELPEYMIPAYFIKIDKMPLTHNGKVDKKALPEPTDYIFSGEEYVAATTEETSIIAEVWAEVLELEKVGISDNYFALGGDSIKAIQIVSKLRDKGININVKDILVHQTIEQLCDNVDTDIKGKEYYQGIVEGELILTPIQQWFFERNFTNSHYYNQSVILSLKKPIEICILEEAFMKLIEHHDGLRLNYDENKKMMYFNNFRKHNFEVCSFDVSHLSPEEQLQAIEKCGVELKGNFHITKDILIKAAVFNLGKEELLLITAHHLLVDGVSWRIILEDLVNVYEALLNKEEYTLPKKTASLLDWNEKVAEYFKSKELQKEKDLWRHMERKGFKLPADFTNEQCCNNYKGKVHGGLTKEMTSSLLTKANKPYNTQINHLLITALYKTITQWTGEKVVALEMEGHGRNIEDIDISRTVGWFTAIYPVILQCNSKNLKDNIKEIKEQLMDIPNNGVGYGILKYLDCERNLLGEEENIPEIRFNYLGQFNKEADNELFSMANLYTGEESGELNLMTSMLDINCMVVNGAFSIEFAYNKKQYKVETIENVRTMYLNNLRMIIEHTENVDKVEFTPSDFSGCHLEQKDIDELFNEEKGIKGEEVENILTLTSLQEKMLNCYKINPNSQEYFVQISLRLQSAVDIHSFKEAWNIVIGNNDVLRTVYRWEGLSNAVQIIKKHHQVPLRILDLSCCEGKKSLKDFKAADIKEGINLCEAPFRLSLCKLSEEEYEMILSSHHILYDGWSNGIILKEFIEAYSALNNGEVAAVKGKLQFKDFIIHTECRDKEKDEAYWRKYLLGYNEKVTIPKDNCSKDLKVIGGNHIASLRSDISKAAEEFCRERRVTQAVLFYTAWAMLLNQYDRKEDIVFGTTISGRKVKLKGVENIVGLCINTIPLRINVAETIDIEEVLQSVNENLKSREEFENTPFEDIKQYSELNNEKSLFDTAVIVENYPLDKGLKSEDSILKLACYEAFEMMNYDITLQIMTFGDIKMKFIYNEALFNRETIENMANCYCEVIENIIKL